MLDGSFLASFPARLRTRRFENGRVESTRNGERAALMCSFFMFFGGENQKCSVWCLHGMSLIWCVFKSNMGGFRAF